MKTRWEVFLTKLHRPISDRVSSMIIFVLFSSWLLSFLFEGQILYALAASHNYDPGNVVTTVIVLHFIGLLFGGTFIKSLKMAVLTMTFVIGYSILVSVLFLFAPSALWVAGLLSGSLLAGFFISGWGYYLKSFTSKENRYRTVADGLIYSNLLMMVLNSIAINVQAAAGLMLSMLALAVALGMILYYPLPYKDVVKEPALKTDIPAVSLRKPLLYLYIFVILITILSGLMYQVMVPAFAHLTGLTSWFWAVPYMTAIIVMRNLPGKRNRNYSLYLAITMIGLSFVFFMTLGRSSVAYLVVDTFMMAALGIYDLFWWIILADMLDYDDNPAKILGIGLSANVLGVLLGGVIGKLIGANQVHVILVAMFVLSVTLSVLPLLNRKLTSLLKSHAFLLSLKEGTLPKQMSLKLNILTHREQEIVLLLLEGKDYRAIAQQLFISNNTVKSHIKNIYEKLHVHTRAELIIAIMNQQHSEV